MVIPVRFSYTYKKYPFSPKATKRSMQLGILTCGAMCLVYGLFWVAIVNRILILIGIDMGNAAIILSLISLVGLVVLIRCIKRNGAQKVERMAMADLMALQNTDPAAFAQYAAVFAQELSRYQAAYQYQAPYQHQAPPQYQYQTSTQYHAPQTPPASGSVQSAPKQGFDIQTEQPEPVPEEPVVVKVPAQQPDVIELPEIQPEISAPVPEQPEPPVEQPAPADEPAIPEKKFCGQCGTKLKSGSLFCHNCGSKL